MSENGDFIEIDKMSIDQFAGSVVLILGAIGSLLLVIWQSRCACKCRIGCSDKCYIFDCSREPPNQQEIDNLEQENVFLLDTLNDIDVYSDIEKYNDLKALIKP